MDYVHKRGTIHGYDFMGAIWYSVYDVATYVSNYIEHAPLISTKTENEIWDTSGRDHYK